MISRFAKSFEKDKQMIRDQIQLAARNLAVTAHAAIISASPIWAGDYISSHHIGISAQAAAPPIDTRAGYAAAIPLSGKPGDKAKLIPEASMAEKAAFVAAAAAKAAQFEGAPLYASIHIHNENEHAMKVEKIGTPRNPQGYHVYGLAHELLMTNGNMIANLKNRVSPSIVNISMIMPSASAEKDKKKGHTS